MAAAERGRNSHVPLSVLPKSVSKWESATCDVAVLKIAKVRRRPGNYRFATSQVALSQLLARFTLATNQSRLLPLLSSYHHVARGVDCERRLS
jgi:hypothetical protein